MIILYLALTYGIAAFSENLLVNGFQRLECVAIEEARRVIFFKQSCSFSRIA